MGEKTEARKSLLDTINSPGDLKKIPFQQLPALAGQIRRRLIGVISKNGGHLASNLGVVELSIALHRIFDCPKDTIVFDVGHQCYTHKLLTGRRMKFHTLRKKDGVSGFPKRAESEYDAFIAGHSGTSISAAIGFARAKKLSGSGGKVVALIGDGSFSGLAFEAVNNIDRSLDNLVIILNDNEMSISKNVSPLGRHLAKIRNTGGYYSFKDEVERLVKRIPVIGNATRGAISGLKKIAKNMIYHSNMFEEMGLTYIGPVDGHSLPELCATLTRARELDEPVLLHVHTIKGRGYRPAEENPGAFHGVSRFDPREVQSNDISDNSFSEQFGIELEELGRADKRIVAITAAMKYATGLRHFSRSFRDEGRFFDVGIAESHAAVFASAMAVSGLIPVFAVYSSFLQRSYDQLLHDCSLESTHVVLAVDRAGLVGEDGETHQGIFDVPFLITLPGITIYSPATYEALKRLLSRAVYNESGLVAVRYPRGGERELLPKEAKSFENYVLMGEGKTLIVTYGRIFGNVLKAAKAKGGAAVVLLERIFPLPAEVIDMALKYKKVVFVEEASSAGGLGEHFGGKLLQNGFRGKYINRGIQNPVVPQGTLEENLSHVGLDTDSIIKLL